MKNLITLFLLLLSSVGYSQYPIQENFNSINGPNEWQNLTGQPDVCAHLGTDLCFNCTSVYNANDIYIATSPYYGSQFVTDLCDSIIIIFDVDIKVRPGDQLFVLWNDYVSGLGGALVPGSGTWSVQLPPQIDYFAFQFETFGTGPIGNGYIHIDWFTISCANYLLDIDLLDWECKSTDKGVAISANLSEPSDIELEWSEEGWEWESLETVHSEYLTYLHKSKHNNNYYRIKYGDTISNTVHCYEQNPSINIKEIRYFNVLGQKLSGPEDYHLKQVIYNNGETKTTIHKCNH